MNKATGVPSGRVFGSPQEFCRHRRLRGGGVPRAAIAAASLLLLYCGGTATARDEGASPPAGKVTGSFAADSGQPSGSAATETQATQDTKPKEGQASPPQPQQGKQRNNGAQADPNRAAAAQGAGQRVGQPRVPQPRVRTSSRTRTSPRWYQPSGGRTVVYGGSWWGGAYGGVGDIYRGMAAIIDARANLLRAQSEALINIEEARSRYIDNRIKWAQFYLEWRRLGELRRREYWAEKRAARDRYLAMIRQREPERLTPSQLDPITGHINWPVILTDPRFDEPRKKLEELFALRAYAGATPDFSRKVLQYVDQMRSELLTLIREIPANEYMQARRFLDLLRRETFYVSTQ